MQSIAARIRTRLIERLKAVDGAAPFVSDFGGRVLGEVPTLDTLANVADDHLPCAFLWRQPGTEERTTTPNTALEMKMVRWSVIAVDAAGDDPGGTQERLYADLERALELPGDLHLVDAGQNLLADELRIAQSSFSADADMAGLALVSVDILTAYPHHYGDPSRI